MSGFPSAVCPTDISEHPLEMYSSGPPRCRHGTMNFSEHGSPAPCCWLCRPYLDPVYARTAKPVFFPRSGDFNDRERLHANTLGTSSATCPNACPKCGSLLHTTRTRDSSGEWECAECSHKWKPKQ